MAAKKTKKAEPQFDVDKANALLNELGGLTVNDSCYAKAKWAGISLVIDFDDEGISLSGFVYDTKGKAKPAVPENEEIFDVAEALRDTMHAGGKHAWRSALVQLTQPGPEIEMKFDYEGGEWDTDAEGLRPDTLVEVKAPVKTPAKKKAAPPKKKTPAKKKPTKR